MLCHLPRKALEKSVHLLLDHHQRHIESVLVKQAVPGSLLQFCCSAVSSMSLEILPDVRLEVVHTLEFIPGAGREFVVDFGQLLLSDCDDFTGVFNVLACD